MRWYDPPTIWHSKAGMNGYVAKPEVPRLRRILELWLPERWQRIGAVTEAFRKELPLQAGQLKSALAADDAGQIAGLACRSRVQP